MQCPMPTSKSYADLHYSQARALELELGLAAAISGSQAPTTSLAAPGPADLQAASSRSPRGSPGASSAPPEADLAGNGLGAEAGAGAAAGVDPEADGQGELPRLRSKTVKQEKRKDR